MSVRWLASKASSASLATPGLLIVMLTGCGETAALTPQPCYERYRAINVDDEVAELGITPQDAVGMYQSTFLDGEGIERTVDVQLTRATAGWVRDIVREPTFGYEETPACDVRVGVELEIRLMDSEGWFAEGFFGAIVRTPYEDAWIARAIKPIQTLDGSYPETRDTDAPEACEQVNLGFSLSLEDGVSGGRIVEQSPGRADEEDPCFREVLAWDLPEG